MRTNTIAIKAILFIIFVQFYSCKPKYILLPNDLSKLGLKNYVKSIDKAYYKVKNHMGELEIVGEDIDCFSCIIYKEFPYKKLYFNNKGNIVKYIYRSPSQDTLFYEYDNRERLLRTTVNGFTKYIVEYFDKEKRSQIIENVSYTFNNKKVDYISKQYKYYDADNNLIKEETYMDDVLDSRKILEYNSEGQNIIIKSYTLENNGDLVAFEKFDFDNNNNIIHRVFKGYTHVDTLHQYFVYDQHNNLINLTEPRSSNYTNNKVFVYKYDNEGNWVERLYYEDDKPKYLTKRNIEYY